MNKIAIPRGANAIVQGLQGANYDAYVVGGCVRDSLLGLEPKDWDVCTSATPDEMKQYFHCHGVRTIDTGLKHGAITVDMEQAGKFEVTTFRIDSNYSDGRHPDSVEFTESIYQDLARRDFTVNAMAFNQAGLVDPYHGREDLENKIIRCAGNPDDRFQEDALRILRALRFASTYGFHIEENTKASIHKNRNKLTQISAERIQSELCKMLCGEGLLNILLEFSDVFAVIIPELQPCIGFQQNNPYHQYTVYDHIAHAVANYTGSDISVKVALLLHDIGKPLCYTEDERGGHFHGHAAPSKDIAELVLNRLRFDNRTKREVLELILYHDSVIEPTIKTVRRWLNKIGEHRLSQLLDVRLADIYAHAEGTQASRVERCISVRAIMEEILEEKQCFSMKDLEIKGSDIVAIGVPEGKLVGETLRHILDLVVAGELDNSIDVQLAKARTYLAERGVLS